MRTTTAAGPREGLPQLRPALARAGRENFTVASRVLPAAVRGHLLAVYAFARVVDDVGDESAGDRAALLDLLERDLLSAYEGVPRTEVVARLVPTIRAFHVPPDPFRHLIEANRQDQVVRAYETYEELLAYCRRSANPVGRVVLRILGADTPANRPLSDAVCTGLQLAEHWQDVAEDLRRDRVYLPAEDLERFGCRREDLAARRSSPRLRRLLAFEVSRAGLLLRAGLPLPRRVGGRPGIAIAGYMAGGLAALEAIRRAGYDVLRGAPRASRLLRARWLLRTLAEARVRRWS